MIVPACVGRQARSIYFEIVKGCLEIESMYGSAEIFPNSFILDMIAEYQSVALGNDNFDKKRPVIQKEVDELLSIRIPYGSYDRLRKI